MLLILPRASSADAARGTASNMATANPTTLFIPDASFAIGEAERYLYGKSRSNYRCAAHADLRRTCRLGVQRRRGVSSQCGDAAARSARRAAGRGRSEAH